MIRPPRIDLASNPERVAVRQDGVVMTRGQLRAEADQVSQRLIGHRAARVGCDTGRADRVVVALAAGDLAESEIVLLRGRYDDRWLTAAGISGVIEDDLSVRWLGPPVSGRDGFHVVLQTSGTTGMPKLVRHTFAALTGRIRQPRVPSERARWLLTYEPASYAGLQVVLTALLSGDELVAVSDRSIGALTAAALSSGPTHISGTPTFWRGLLVSAGAAVRQLPLAQITLGGEMVDDPILRRLRAEFPMAGITHIYASTEAGALFAVKDGLAGFPRRWLEEGTEGVHLRLTDGVLEVLSPRRMVEYVTAVGTSKTGDGWLTTGDLVAIEGERAYFRGRVDTTISVGGAKVAPEEVEAVLLAVPGVLEARAFPVPNPLTGNLVGAELVCGPVDQEVMRRAVLAHAGAMLASYKVPRVVRFVEALTISVSGKKSRRDG